MCWFTQDSMIDWVPSWSVTRYINGSNQPSDTFDAPPCQIHHQHTLLGRPQPHSLQEVWHVCPTWIFQWFKMLHINVQSMAIAEEVMNFRINCWGKIRDNIPGIRLDLGQCKILQLNSQSVFIYQWWMGRIFGQPQKSLQYTDDSIKNPGLGGR